MIEDLNKEELNSKREIMAQQYKEQIEFLKLQKEYNVLIRDITVAQAEALNAKLAIAQLNASTNEKDTQEGK